MKSDLEMRCQDCDSAFYFTVGEQEFYKQKGFEAPKRCQKCRRARKSQQFKPS